MRLLRILLWSVGALLVLFGAIWILQGLGLLMWPAESFMLADRQWAINGAITVLVGLGLIWAGRRLRG